MTLKGHDLLMLKLVKYGLQDPKMTPAEKQGLIMQIKSEMRTPSGTRWVDELVTSFSR